MKKIVNESLFELKNLAQVKAVGDQIFFTQTQMKEDKNAYHTDLICMNASTKQKVIWGNDTGIHTGLELSPNKDWLSFLSKDEETKAIQIYLMPLSGGKAIRLTDEKGGIHSYQWSKDSLSVYYSTEKKEDEKEPEKDKNVQDKPNPTEIKKVMYKLDGQGFIENDTIHIVKKIQIDTKLTEEIMVSKQSFSLNYISKNEDFLLFTKGVNLEEDWNYGISHIYSYELATKETSCLTEHLSTPSLGFETINEKEDLIILSGNFFEYAFVSQNKLFSLNRHSKELTCLTPVDLEVGDVLVADFQQNVLPTDCIWLDDHSFIFLATKDGKTQLYISYLNGELECLLDEPLHITSFDLSQDKTSLWITYSTLTLPSGLARFDLTSKTLHTCYNPNEQWEKEHAIQTPERFWFKGHNNWAIQAWYLHPVEEKEKHPAILYIHGGPQVCYGESFFHEMQVLAGLGYGVIMINPRGGNGYGQEFVASILGDYGNHDYDDLMLGVDECLNRYSSIDQNQVFVTGGSYGGFMTNWIVTHTDRFKAAVTQRSISNWISFYGTSDVGPFFVEYQLQQDLSNSQRLWELSPLAYASNAKTPLLILHGEEDLRCPLEQAQQFYIAMRKYGVPTKLITFPQSSHGLSRIGLPNLRMKRLEAIQEWFAKYL